MHHSEDKNKIKILSHVWISLLNKEKKATQQTKFGIICVTQLAAQNLQFGIKV